MGIKVYDYKCNNCHSVQEFWLEVGEEPTCCRNPDCKSSALTKQHPAPNFNMGKTPYEEYL